MRTWIKSFLLIFFIPCSGLKAQCYFPDSDGTTLEYVRKYVKDGKFCWRHMLTVTGVEDVDGKRKVTTSSRFLKVNGKPLYDSDVLETVYVDDEGNVHGDVGESLASYIKARVGVNATGTGDFSALPYDMQPGDTLPTVTAKVKVGPLTYTVRVHDRKVLREETISLPGGTFKCMVVKERRDESGPGYRREVITDTWYCPGIGYARHDTYRKGKVETSEMLYSVKR